MNCMTPSTSPLDLADAILYRAGLIPARRAYIYYAHLTVVELCPYLRFYCFHIPSREYLITIHQKQLRYS